MAEIKRKAIALKKELNWDGSPHESFKEWKFINNDYFLDKEEGEVAMRMADVSLMHRFKKRKEEERDEEERKDRKKGKVSDNAN